MPTTLALNNNLVSYTRGVFADSYHHAPGVTPVLPHILTCLLMYADPGSIAVRLSNRGFARECWFMRNGARYCLSYVHNRGGRIELRRRSQQGAVIAVFRGSESWQRVRAVFRAL